MKTSIKDSKRLYDVLAAPYAAAVDTGMLIGEIFGFATAAIANGGTGVLATEGVFLTSNILASDAWTEGLALYWDNTNKRITITSSSNTKIGYAAQVKAGAVTSGLVVLNGKTG